MSAGTMACVTQVIEPEAGECAQCEDVWPADELRLDANLDLICPDCVSTNAGVAEADAAAYRSYAYSGR